MTPKNISDLLKANALRAQLPAPQQAACDLLVEQLHLILASEPLLPVRLLAMEIMRQQAVAQARHAMAGLSKEMN